MIPTIGIVANTGLNRFQMPTTTVPVAYSRAIEKGGGIPLILPVTSALDLLPAMIGRVHGLLFIGGGDIDPDRYGRSPIPALGDVDRDLDRFQAGILTVAMARRLPVLAICRGLQLVNVVLGGTLFQDIAAEVNGPVLAHTLTGTPADASHDIMVAPGSRLYRLFGPGIPVNSRHHQAIDTVAKGLIVTARAPDGIIEAAEHAYLPMDLVQWHPERMLMTSGEMLPLFQSFVDRCR